MRTSDLRLEILKTVRGKEFYGYGIHQKLISEGLSIGFGRLYKVLNSMLQDGLLESYWEKSKIGPKKRMYKLGKKGKEELNKILLLAVQTIHAAYGEYLLNLPPEKSVFQRISKQAISGTKDQSNVVLVVEDASPMYPRLLRNIQNEVPESKIFVIKPKTVKLDFQIENIVVMEGDQKSVPLKENYADLLITVNLPTIENMQIAVREWRRIIKNDGRLLLLSPNVVFEGHEDPLSIGDFIEKFEHQTYVNRKPGEGAFLLTCLRKQFQIVNDQDIVHMKVISAYSSADKIKEL